MKRFISILALLLIASAPRADIVVQATITNDDSGAAVCNFADTLGYIKPWCRSSADVPATVFLPSYSEGSIANKYYVDLTSGSGSTCSQGSPCDSLLDLNGKTGINGGPAIIYLKGSGDCEDQALVGTASNPIIFKPWDDSTSGTCTGRNNWQNNKRFVLFDGGPNLRLRFNCTATGGFDPCIYFSENSADTTTPTSMTFQSVTFYRTQWNASVDGALWFASYGAFTELAFVNSEFFSVNTGAQKHIYISQCGTGDGRLGRNLSIIGNILRDTPGEPVELRMAAPDSELNGFLFEGNAVHNVGKGTCGGGFNCRSVITYSSDNSGCGASGGAFTGTQVIQNNITWDVGQHAVALYDFPSSGDIQGNTFLLWGNGGAGGGQYPEAALSNFAFDDAPGDIANDILYAIGTYGGDARRPFPNNAQPSGAQYNACTSSSNCTSSGTSGTKQTVSSSDFLGTDENDPDWGKMTGSSPTKDAGTSASGRCPAKDYFGTTRPVGAACDIGAFEQ